MTLPHATTPLPSVAGASPIRQTEKHPHPEGHALPVRLALQGTAPAGLRYALTCYWEARHAGRVQRTMLEKKLTLHYLPVSAERARLTYLEAPPVLRKPDLSAFEKAVLLLASLYQHLELDVSPTGQLLALHNHAAILETWDAVEQELVRRSAGEDDVTQDLRTAMGTLLQDPANLLASLGYDYAFGWLLPDFYGQRFESGWRYVRPRSFDRFFAEAACVLWSAWNWAAHRPTGRPRCICAAPSTPSVPTWPPWPSKWMPSARPPGRQTRPRPLNRPR